jgi:hypothetical protein
MKLDRLLSAGGIALAFCLTSAPGAVANVVPDLRDTDLVLVFNAELSEVRWFRVAECPDFRKIPILTRLSVGKGKVDADPPDEFTRSVERCGTTTRDSSIRVIGSPTAVWVFAAWEGQGGPDKVEIKEVRRKTRFETDLQTLLKIVLKEGGVTRVIRTASVAVWGQPLQYTRANVLVTVTWDALKSPAVTLVTGPAEHLYLSADLPVDNVSAVKYDEATGAVASRSAPATFYGGLNYSLGDIGLEKASWSWSSVSIKLMMQISSKPLDGLGAGLGFRLPATEVWGFKLNALSVFGAAIWLREDSSVSGTPAVVETRYKAKLRAGLSLNLDAALGWIKG